MPCSLVIMSDSRVCLQFNCKISIQAAVCLNVIIIKSVKSSHASKELCIPQSLSILDREIEVKPLDDFFIQHFLIERFATVDGSKDKQRFF